MVIMEPYGLKDVYITKDIYITMTKQELIDKLQPHFYHNDHIEIRTYKDGDIGVVINGFMYNKRHINQITGIDLNMIKIKKKTNLDSWRELNK